MHLSTIRGIPPRQDNEEVCQNAWFLSHMSTTPKLSPIDTKRHSTAHILAAAIIDMFPEAKFGTGPVVDNGFYYDVDLPRTLIPEDLPILEKKMRKIMSRNDQFQRAEINIEEAKKRYEKSNQPYKVELIEDLMKQGEKEVSFYQCGTFVDLCAGPHIDSAGEINKEGFKLTKIAGAYWKADENRQQMQRVYGVLFDTKEELKQWQRQQEEAKARDHRKIGKELDLFVFSDLVGAGLPLFTAKGTLLRDLIVQKIQNLQKDFGYQRVTIPHITKKDLYQTSGHWEKFGDELFKVKGQSDQKFVMKPMNCPHHTQIFAGSPKSYKELPVRMMETTMVYRDEQAGELLGLSRVRSISQDDGHVFCRPDQIEKEVQNIVTVIREFYTSLDMFKEEKYWVSISVRDPQTPEQYLGDPTQWDKAEKILEDIAKKEHLPYKRVEGEAAFYGPKLDFMFKDALGREWQLATAQLDFVMPERFKLEYTSKEGKKERPVMIHRAIAGSLERFLSVIIEHFAGAFPTWLCPVQAIIIPVSDKFSDYAKKVARNLQKENIRVEIDNNNDTLG
ncbi:MAG: threonine--tRNA ligase, partial [Candidatus Moranbacteria bacterium]|nr:threonine--tRNA ligase [Candidatus Moranbacteria bacterium]